MVGGSIPERWVFIARLVEIRGLSRTAFGLAVASNPDAQPRNVGWRIAGARSNVDGMNVCDVKRAVTAMAPIVRAHADDADRRRRLSEVVVDGLKRTGINRLLLPRQLGGLEASTLDVMEIGEQIATVDGSTAWSSVIGTGSNLFAGYLPESGARRVFADRDQSSATMLAPAGTLEPVDGGRFRLSGRWPFASNVPHSAWIGLGAFPADHSGPAAAPLQVAFVPVEALTIEDSWHADGLRGTGSHHVVADDVIIEPDVCCTFNGPAWADGEPWRLPIVAIYLPLLACVPLGIARGALDAVAGLTRTGREARRGQLIDDPLALADLGDADTSLRAAREGLRTAVSEAQQLARDGQPISRSVQARICLAAQHANDVAVASTSAAHALGGGAAAYRDHPLRRALADVHTGRQHLMFARQHRSELTKAAIGIDIVYPPFVVAPSDATRPTVSTDDRNPAASTVGSGPAPDEEMTCTRR